MGQMGLNNYVEQDEGLPVEQLPDFAAINAMVEAWKNVNGRSYFVYKGAYNWAQHDFAAQPLAVAIMVGDQGFLQDLNSNTVVFEAFTSMPAMGEGRTEDGIDVGKQALLKRDVRTVVGILMGATYPNSVDNIFDRWVGRGDSMLDMSDQVARTQGVLAQFTVDF